MAQTSDTGVDEAEAKKADAAVEEEYKTELY